MRYAIRSLLKAPGFSLLVILTLGLGIGANTAIFSVFRGVLLRPLPHENGDEIVYLRQSATLAGLEDVKFSVPEIIDLRESSRSLTGFAEFSAMPFTMLGAGRPVQVQAGIVTGNFFEVMGLSPVLGRAIGPVDGGAAAAPVMMLTYEYWQRAFGADPGVIGKVVRMNGRSVTIVGVLEPAPPFPGETDVFVNLVTSPHHLDATMVHGRSHRMTDVFARLAPGASVEQAQAEIDGITARMYADYPDHYDAASGYTVSITPLRDALVSEARLTLYLLLAAAGLVLLTTCANVANLVLTRNLKRDREFAVRWAMGADGARLRAILLAENGILAALGAGLGLLLAYGGLDLMVSFAARFTTRASEIRMDGGVLLFAVVVASAAAIVFALAPSLVSREMAAAVLTRSGSRTTGGRRRLQRGLIVAQIAASVTVLTAAGLLGRTLMRLNAVDPGVDVENTLTLEVPADHESHTQLENLALEQEMQRRIAALPGVHEVGVGMSVPLRPNQLRLEVKVEGRPPEPGKPIPTAEYRTATPELFEAAGMEILAGRGFSDTDGPESPRVAILNQALAELLFGDENPIGRRVAWTGQVLSAIGMKEDDWRTVVGVVSNTRDFGPQAPPPPTLFQPLTQNDIGYFGGAFVIRADRAPSLAPRVQRIINQLAPELPVLRVATLEQIRQENIAAERLNTLLVSALGVLALIISTVGLVGILSFFVRQRTTEIGIRMSLGAAPLQVLRMVLADGATMLGAGTLLGILGSFAVGRLLEGMLFGVAPIDPLTLAAVTLVMIAVGLAACAVPAMRAARVDPMIAIQTE
ncbi:MAG TPA: ABC transporter permease [Longimicrobiales bacterium]